MAAFQTLAVSSRCFTTIGWVSPASEASPNIECTHCGSTACLGYGGSTRDPETNIHSPWKWDGWKTRFPMFRGENMLVLGSVGCFWLGWLFCSTSENGRKWSFGCQSLGAQSFPKPMKQEPSMAKIRPNRTGWKAKPKSQNLRNWGNLKGKGKNGHSFVHRKRRVRLLDNFLSSWLITIPCHSATNCYWLTSAPGMMHKQTYFIDVYSIFCVFFIFCNLTKNPDTFMNKNLEYCSSRPFHWNRLELPKKPAENPDCLSQPKSLSPSPLIGKSQRVAPQGSRQKNPKWPDSWKPHGMHL